MLVVVSFVVQDWHCDGEERQTQNGKQHKSIGTPNWVWHSTTGQTHVARSAEHLACEHFTALWLHASASILKYLNRISVRITSVSSSTESWERRTRQQQAGGVTSSLVTCKSRYCRWVLNSFYWYHPCQEDSTNFKIFFSLLWWQIQRWPTDGQPQINLRCIKGDRSLANKK